jgi:hypothetical protein
MISQTFGWSQSDLLALYDNKLDTHNSEHRTRYMWEYALSQGIYNTPGLMVNGISINDMQPNPLNATQLMRILQDTYNNQRVTFGDEL